MTVHIGQITSEVDAGSAPTGGSDAAGSTAVDRWEEQARLAALLDRLSRDRYRTATGHGDD